MAGRPKVSPVLTKLEEGEPLLVDFSSERLACSWSFTHWIETYGRISDPDGGDMPFVLWPHIRLLAQLMDEERLLQILKARQVGVSWVIAARALWIAKFHQGANVLLLSQGQVEATKLLQKCKFLEEKQPVFLRSAVGKSNESEMTFPRMHSQILALPATEKAGRGEGATLVVLDEFAFHPYAETNFKAVKPTIDTSGGRLIVVSTANGMGGMFHELWQESTRLGPLAVPKEKERQKTVWLGARPPAGFRAVFVPWGCRPERDAAWYRKVKNEYSKSDLAQEYPADPREAFVQSGRPVFDSDDCVLGPLVNPVHVGLWPARLGRWKRDLILWRLPQRGHQYLVGADPAQGLATGDRTAVEVLDASDHQQIGELCGPLAPDELAEFLYDLGSVFPSFIAVERNNHGHAVLLRLRELCARGVQSGDLWPSRLYHAVRTFRVPIPDGGVGPPEQRRELGWLTTQASKPILVSQLEEALRKKLISLSSQALLGELIAYQRLADGDTGAPSGLHDDRVMALGIAYQMRNWIGWQVVPLPYAVKGLQV